MEAARERTVRKEVPQPNLMQRLLTGTREIHGQALASEESKYTKNNQQRVSTSVRPFAFLIMRHAEALSSLF
jgi:hypothetical protein